MTIIARVNGEDIDSKMLDGAVSRYIVQLEEDESSNFEPTPQGMKFIRAEALKYLIERVALLQVATSDGFSVTHDEAHARMRQIRAKFDTDSDFANNLLILGVDTDNAIDEVARDMLLEKYLDAIYSRTIELSDETLERYFEENKTRMKQPDLYTFYEVMVSSPAQVNTAALIFTNSKDVGEIEEKIKAIDGEFRHEADFPSFQLPEEVFNILSDLEEGKVGTMVIDDHTIMVYKLIRRMNGKSFAFDEIKESLRGFMNESGRKTIYADLVSKLMETAKVEYVDTDYLEGK
jgi:hypothetical protein